MRHAVKFLLVLFLGATAPIFVFGEPAPTPPTVPTPPTNASNRRYLPVCTLVKVPPQAGDQKSQMREAAAIGASRKMMAEIYSERCDIDVEFFTHMIKNPSNLIRLTDRQNPGDKLLQEQAEEACNFYKELGERGATQVIDYSNELATRMCDNGPAQGCSTLCKPASFSIVNVKDQPIASFVRTSLHEFFHSNCCGRACLNQGDDGTGTRFGFDIVLALNDLSPDELSCHYAAGVGANSNPLAGIPTPSSSTTDDEQEAKAEAEMEKYRVALGVEVETALQQIRQEADRIRPDVFRQVCDSIRRGAGKNPRNAKYDKDKAFYKYYGGKEARHLARENARDFGGTTGLPKNLLPSLAEDPAVLAAIEAAKKGKGKAGEAELDAAIAASAAGKDMNALQRRRAAIRLNASLKDQESRPNDSKLSGAPATIEDVGVSGGGDSTLFYSADKLDKPKPAGAAPANSTASTPAPTSTPNYSTSISGGGNSSPAGSRYEYDNGRTPTALVGEQRREKGGRRGLNDAIIVQEGRNGGSIKQNKEDVLERTDTDANRRRENREIQTDYQ